MILRQFKPEGIAAFKAILAECREDPTLAIPTRLLEDSAFTSAVKDGIVVAPRTFTSRRDAAQYLSELLAPLPEDEVAKNAGLWTWLTLFYFDQVCPLSNGRRSVKNDYYYIFEPKNTRHFYDTCCSSLGTLLASPGRTIAYFSITNFRDSTRLPLRL